MEGANHLGVPLCSTKRAEILATESRIQIHKKNIVHARHGGINPMSASKVYLSIAMPRLLYGCQVWPISDNNVNLMERAHQDAARRLQGLPQQRADPAATALMGWLSVRATIDMYRLFFLWTLIRIPNILQQIVSDFLIESFHKSFSKCNGPGPLCMLARTCHKYNIQDTVIKLLILNLNRISRYTWKKIVKNIVWSHYKNNWYMECIMYKSLSIFLKCVNSVAMSWLWHLCKDRPKSIRKCKSTARMLISNTNLYVKYTRISRLCPLCSMYCRLCHEHVLFECPALDNERVKCWTRVTLSMPPAMQSEVEHMNNSRKLIFVFSGLNCNYMKEWIHIYDEMVNFMYNLNRSFQLLAGQA